MRDRRILNRTPALFATAAVLLLAGLLPAAGPTLADGPDLASGITQGDDFLISRAQSLRGSPAIAYNEDLDEYLVVWADARQNLLQPDIYGQIVSSAGVPRGDSLVIHDESHLLAFPDVAYDTVNQVYLVVWEDEDEDDIEGQLLDPDGNPAPIKPDPFDIADGTTSDSRDTPAVTCYAHAANGAFAVAYRRGSAGNYNIFCQLVKYTGTLLGSETAICTANGDQTDPDVAVDPGGDFLIVWDDSRSSLPATAIYGCRLPPSGMLIDIPFKVFGSTTNPSYDPAVAFNSTAGEWLVVFERDVSGDSQIGGRRVTAAGATAGDLIHICTDSADQNDPDVTYNASSNQYLVVWEDTRNTDTTRDIYGRRVNATGGTVADSFTICTAASDQFDPVVAASPTAPGYLVVFPDLGSSTEDISGQRVSTAEALQGHMFAISAPAGDGTNPAEQRQPAVAYNSQDKEFLVVWQDKRDGRDDYDIWGQRVDLDGTLLEDNLAICTKLGEQILPDLAYNLDTNQYLVVWEDRAGTNTDIHGQRVNADGSLDSTEFLLSYTSGLARRRPHVTFNPISGEYFVVYLYEGETNDIRARRVPASSTPSTIEILVAIDTADQNYPDVACRTMEPGGGDYLIVWRETSDTTLRDIKGQRRDQNGSFLANLDICTDPTNQWTPRVTYSPDHDRYLVVWPDDRNSTPQGRDVYGRQVSGAGTLYAEFAVSTASENQAPVAAAYGSGLGDYVVAWEDERNAGTTPDIYGQRIDGTGALVDTPSDTNESVFEYSGWQQAPAVAWGGDGQQGLVVWQDGRNGDTYRIYGRCLANYVVYIPLVMRD